MRFYIKEARERVGLSQKDLAEKLNLKPTTFNGYETGAHDPKSNILAKIATELRTTTDYLLGLTNNPEIPSSDYSFSAEYISLANKYRRLDAHGRDMVDIVLDREYTRSISIKETADQEENNLITFPVSPSKASAGSGYLLFDDDQNEIWKVIDNELIRKADIGIVVFGDSMEPLYSDGDVLLVRKQPDIEIGEIGIFIKDGQSYVKKKGKDRLISLNKLRPDIYPSEFDEIYCFGKVVGKLEPEWIVEK